MTPKEKAKDLVDKYYLTKDERGLCRLNEFIAKQCASIAVDLLLDSLDWDYFELEVGIEHKYWKKVKQEIEKL
jgi:hypothetical protein